MKKVLIIIFILNLFLVWTVIAAPVKPFNPGSGDGSESSGGSGGNGGGGSLEGKPCNGYMRTLVLRFCGSCKGETVEEARKNCGVLDCKCLVGITGMPVDCKWKCVKFRDSSGSGIVERAGTGDSTISARAFSDSSVFVNIFSKYDNGYRDGYSKGYNNGFEASQNINNKIMHINQELFKENSLSQTEETLKPKTGTAYDSIGKEELASFSFWSWIKKIFT